MPLELQEKLKTSIWSWSIVNRIKECMIEIGHINIFLLTERQIDGKG